MKKMVIALGGNALGNNLTEQLEAVKITAKAIVDLIEDEWTVVVAHGNGPQVGMLNNAMSALEREDPKQENIPLSVCVAMSQSYIGADLQNALREELLRRGIKDKPVATVVTQVRVEQEDPAFHSPSKPIGQFMTEEEAKEAQRKYGFITKEDAGRGYRRVVPSPLPKEIIELSSISSMVDTGQLVVACGGGGIPVIEKEGGLSRVDAVIDKDFASCLMAKDLDADFLVILTAVEKVALNYGKNDEVLLDELSVEEAKKYIEQGHFAPGSMLPKVQAAIDFADSKEGRTALITLLEKARDGINGQTGTRIHK